MPRNVTTVYSDPHVVERYAASADLVIGAVEIDVHPGGSEIPRKAHDGTGNPTRRSLGLKVDLRSRKIEGLTCERLVHRRTVEQEGFLDRAQIPGNSLPIGEESWEDPNYGLYFVVRCDLDAFVLKLDISGRE